MALMRGKGTAARAALSYVTTGALMLVWSLVWYWYLSESEAPRRIYYYLCYGFMGTGIILLLIGVGVGRSVQSNREAESAKGTTQTGAPAGQAATQTTPLSAPAQPVAGVSPTQAAPAAVPVNPPVAPR